MKDSPDDLTVEDLLTWYEQGVFPSTFNTGHHFTFTIHKKASWCDKSINLTDLLAATKAEIQIKKIELLDATYRYEIGRLTELTRVDQTRTPIGECGIEFVVKKLA